MRIILCGFGVVGQSFAKLLESRSEDLYAKYGLKPKIVGVFDKTGGVTDTSGLDVSRLIDTKRKHNSVKKYSEKELDYMPQSPSVREMQVPMDLYLLK